MAMNQNARRLKRILIAIDQLLGCLLFDGIGCDESISAYCHRRGYTKRVAIIDWFFGSGHCRAAYMAEKNGTQRASEYRA